MSVTIPFVVGESLHKAIRSGAQSDLSLSAGRWNFSPRSTIPFARVEIANFGGRQVSWGQPIEVPSGTQGIVSNASFHDGDIVFDGAGSGIGGASSPPGTIAIPVTFTPDPAVAFYYSNLLDTRRARRAYLCTRNFAAPDGPLPFFVFYTAPNRGNAFSPAGFAFANGGILNYSTAIFGYKKQAPLGFGSGENQEVAPGANSLPELRPMAFLDALYIRISAANFTSSGINTSNDIYFLVEY